MKAKLYIPILSAVVLAGVMAGCSSASKDKQTQLAELKAQQAEIAKQISTLQAEIAKEGGDATATVKAKDVVVAELATRKFDHYVKTQGSVESEENILVSAKSMGVITHVSVREGEMVSKGQTLAQIDNTLIVRGIEEMKSQLELANTVFERQKNLWDQKIGTEVQFLQAKTNKESLEKRLASMQEQNEMSKIKAPVSGVVDELNVKVGQNIAPGMPAARVVNNSDLKITASVSEVYATQLKQGNKVIVYFPDIDKTLEAKLTFVARNIDQLSRTFAVEASLASTSDLRPNMTAVIKIVYDTAPSALVVPINLVQNINGEKVVYVAESKGKQTIARKKVVTVEGVFDNLAQVSGLSAGDKLITVGFQGLTDGDFVKI
ncbi:MAG: efflux RND transporter periplasmic adaptor subunit [Bacteroidota bacterium]